MCSSDLGGTVDFLGEREWLHRIGFEEIVDSKDARFAEVTVRGPFDAVPDDRLLDVAARTVRERTDDRPLFLAITTFWSHSPYLSQDRARPGGEEAVIRATDKAIAAFYRALREGGFFEHGILFVTGDHRAMSPYSTAEMARFEIGRAHV